MVINYPRKQTLYIFVVCAVLVAATATYASSQKTGATESQNNTLAVSGKAHSNTATVIDPDAFPDWKNQFAADSGKVAAPTSAATKNTPEKLTETDKFGRDLFTRYMQLKEAGQLNNDAVVNQSANDLIDSHIDPSPTKIYVASDITAINSTSQSALNQYSEALSVALNSFRDEKSESDIVQEYLTTNDASVLNRFTTIIAAYKKITANLVRVPTPASYVDQQLALINAFQGLESAAKDLKVTDTDTIKGLSGATLHATAASNLVDALKNIHDTLGSQNVNLDFDQSLFANVFK